MGKYVETNGIRLHYIDHPGEGPVLILMPGLTANAHFFAGIVKAGLVPSLHVLTLDLRGRGESDKPESGYSIADHASDVLGLMDQLGLNQVVLGGHSFGGLLTYYMAAHFPNRVSKCVVIDAPAEVDPTILEQIKPSLARLEMVVPSWEDYLVRVKAMPYYEGWWDPTIEEFYRADVKVNPDGTLQARSRPENIQAAVGGLLEINWPETVRKIRQPTLLLRAADPFGPPGYPPILPEDKAKKTMTLLSDGRLLEFPGNHITFMFGKTANDITKAIISFVFEKSVR
jgi:pimeloyl-ACP methyl ester carboxylesterase